MAFSNIDSLANGSLLQIIFSNGVRNQISVDFRDFEMIKRAKAGKSLARELRFDFQSSLGMAAIQARNPGTTNRAFPLSQQVATAEYTAKFKEINATLELEYNLWSRAMQSPEKYGNPLEIEMDSKASACKRYLASLLYADGTGVVGTVAPASQAATSVTVTSPVSNSLIFQLSTADSARGHAGTFEFQDILLLKTQAGGATALVATGATPVYWKVVSRDFDNQRVTLQGLDSSFAPTASLTAVTTDAGDNEVFYRFGQPTIPDLTASISDYGTVSESIAGLESLTASDSRVIHGITMSGANAGTRFDAQGNPIDVRHIQRVLSNTKRNVGQDRYKWKMMNMAPETHDSLIESRETDRRFQSIEDNKRGVKYFAYVHGNDVVECNGSEYCPPKRIYILPEAKSSEKVLEFHGSDFEPVRPNGADAWSLKPGSTGGHVNMMVSYLQAVGVIVCKHPASVAVITNFTNS